MKKNYVLCLSLSFCLVFCLSSQVFISFAEEKAVEKATKEECEAKCKEAAKMIKELGIDEGIKRIGDKNGQFVWKDSYVFLMDIEKCQALAHPANPAVVNKSLAANKDVDGKMFFVEFVEVAKTKGEGWITYKWPKPGEKVPSPKITYVYRVPDTNYLVGAGIYEN